MMTNKLRIFLAITSTSSSLLILNCLPAIALAPSSGFDANGIDRDVNTDMWEDENEDNPGTVGSPSRPSEDDTGSPRATEPTTTNSVLDFAFGYHCEHPVSYDSGHMRACQFFCVWGLEVGGDSVGVGGGELGEGLFPVGGGASLDEACGGCSFVGGFAGVCEALGGSFVFDVADGEP